MEINSLTVIRARKPSEETQVTVLGETGKYDCLKLKTAKDVSRLIELLKPYAEEKGDE